MLSCLYNTLRHLQNCTAPAYDNLPLCIVRGTDNEIIEILQLLGSKLLLIFRPRICIQRFVSSAQHMRFCGWVAHLDVSF